MQELALVVEAVEVVDEVAIERLLVKGSKSRHRYLGIDQLIDVELEGLHLLEGGRLDLGLADPDLGSQQGIGDTCCGKDACDQQDQYFLAPQDQDQLTQIDFITGRGLPTLGQLTV